MNKYQVTLFNCGQSAAYIVESFDMISAIQCGLFNPSDVVRIELVGSTNLLDMIGA